MTNKKLFGSFIKHKRNEKNLSQKELAEMLFVTEGAVSKWERGISYPDITLIPDICQALDISEHELITASIDTETRKMKHEARKFRVIKNSWFWIPTICYIIALVVCFICNLAVDHTLSWFFIVLSSLICAFTFIPTVTSFFESKKLLAFTLSTYLSICLLLLTCALYVGELSWCSNGCIGVLMGFSIVFLPLLLRNTRFSKYKFLISFVTEYLLTLLLLISIHLANPFMLLPSLLITSYCFLPPILCALLCTFPFDAFLKTGTCTMLCAVAYHFVHRMITLLFGVTQNHYTVDFKNWPECINGNIQFITTASLLFLSLIFFAIGIVRIQKKK